MATQSGALKEGTFKLLLSIFKLIDHQYLGFINKTRNKTYIVKMLYF